MARVEVLPNRRWQTNTPRLLHGQCNAVRKQFRHSWDRKKRAMHPHSSDVFLLGDIMKITIEEKERERLSTLRKVPWRKEYEQVRIKFSLYTCRKGKNEGNLLYLSVKIILPSLEHCSSKLGG